MERVILALGANLGDRRDNIKAAVGLLRANGVDISAVSSFYRTSPVGLEQQPEFINAAAAGVTELAPEQLLAVTKDIERQLGRAPGRRWGPRPVDIDIILYGLREVKTPELEIPHPRFGERLFVLQPVAEIAPDFTMPCGDTVREFYSRCLASFDFTCQIIEKLP